MAYLQWLQGFVNKPFSQPISLGRLFLLIGMIMVIIMLWSRVLAHLDHGVL